MTYIQDRPTTLADSSSSIGSADNINLYSRIANRSIIISILNSAYPTALLRNEFPLIVKMKGMLPTLIFECPAFECDVNAVFYSYDEREVKYIVSSLHCLKLKTEFGRRTLETMDSDTLKYYLEQYCSSPFISFQVV